MERAHSGEVPAGICAVVFRPRARPDLKRGDHATQGPQQRSQRSRGLDFRPGRLRLQANRVADASPGSRRPDDHVFACRGENVIVWSPAAWGSVCDAVCLKPEPTWSEVQTSTSLGALLRSLGCVITTLEIRAGSRSKNDSTNSCGNFTGVGALHTGSRRLSIKRLVLKAHCSPVLSISPPRSAAAMFCVGPVAAGSMVGAGDGDGGGVGVVM